MIFIFTWFFDMVFFFLLAIFPHDLYFTCDLFSWFSFHIIHLLSCYFLPRFIYFKWKFFPQFISHFSHKINLFSHVNFYMIPLFFTLQMMHMYLSAHAQFQDIQCTLHTCTHYSLINHMREKKTHDLIWNVWFFRNRRSHGPAQFQICFVLSTPDPAVVLMISIIMLTDVLGEK